MDITKVRNKRERCRKRDGERERDMVGRYEREKVSGIKQEIQNISILTPK